MREITERRAAEKELRTKLAALEKNQSGSA
jgi:hypothetical protein